MPFSPPHLAIGQHHRRTDAFVALRQHLKIDAFVEKVYQRSVNLCRDGHRERKIPSIAGIEVEGILFFIVDLLF